LPVCSKLKPDYTHFIGHGNSKILTLWQGSGIEICMKSIDEQILRSAKEIIVKFIEMGRLSPSNVHEAFKDVYATVDETVKIHVQKDIPSHDKDK
jgi:hypothetical protein